MRLIDKLRAPRPLYQMTQVQPQQGTLGKPEYKAADLANWSPIAAAIHATRDMLSAPIYGSTNPNEFIQINGAPPKAPVIVQVPTLAGSNMPQGGSYHA